MKKRQWKILFDMAESVAGWNRANIKTPEAVQLAPPVATPRTILMDPEFEDSDDEESSDGGSEDDSGSGGKGPDGSKGEDNDDDDDMYVAAARSVGNEPGPIITVV